MKYLRSDGGSTDSIETRSRRLVSRHWVALFIGAVRVCIHLFVKQVLFQHHNPTDFKKSKTITQAPLHVGRRSQTKMEMQIEVVCWTVCILKPVGFTRASKRNESKK